MKNRSGNMDLSKIFLTEPKQESLVIGGINQDPPQQFNPKTWEQMAVEPDRVKRAEEIMKLVTQETRKESFKQVQETLGERQRIVLDQLKTVYPNGATAKELSNHLYRQGLAPSPERNSVHPRLNELIAKGLVEVIGKKTCQFTNRKVAIYKGR